MNPPETLHGSPPYSVLAAGYDAVMAHVEYDFWAGYIHGFIEQYLPEAHSVLELGCGTGTFALELAKLAAYDYLGTDRSPEMVQVARWKAEREQMPLRFEVADFTTFTVAEPVDVVLLLYDGFNYLLDPESVRKLFRCVHQALRPGGLFLFDQSTPANSKNNEAYFEDEGEVDGFRYVRHSRYDPDARLHTTTFDIEALGRTVREQHVQRAYTLGEVRALVRRAGFEEVAVTQNFSTLPADRRAERIHWVLRKPYIPTR